jgi:hypothetical protein
MLGMLGMQIDGAGDEWGERRLKGRGLTGKWAAGLGWAGLGWTGYGW